MITKDAKKETTKTISTIKNDNVPITKEEFSAFMIIQQNMLKETLATFIDAFKNEIMSMNTVSNNRFDQVLIALNEQNQNMVSAIKNLTTSQAETAKVIKESGETSRKQIYAISNKMFGNDKTAKPNTIFNSSMTPIEQSRWIKKVWGELSKLCEASGIPEGQILNEIYNEMMKSGYNTKSLFEEYKKQDPSVEKRVEMFSKSDVLMKSFGNGFNTIWKKHRNNKLKGNFPEMDTPADFNVNTMTAADSITEIRKAAGKLSKTGRPTGQTYNKAFRLVDDKCGISIRDEAAKIIKAKKMHKATSVIDAVSKDSNLSRIFCDAIYEFLS